ncbi:hypothetical protein LMG29542_04699 [Paraburkholderia humisilvae]|uniref:Uncharacterized protein n=1 Tax=Paraburkholderia humisilvae TaxID=627669 RepID=A0A6J5EEX8_9BURK|nr:hypothetical protein LMG29542_04699 [Paraburkholderia humisilvae]
MLVAFSAPAFTLVSVVPAVPPASVTLPWVESSYATNAFVTLPDVSTFRPAAFSCARFTASESAEPAFTFVIVVPFVPPASVTLSCEDASYFTVSASSPLMFVICVFSELTFWFVAYSCAPFTASVLVAFSAPAFTLVSVVPAVPPASVTLPWVESS